VGGGGGGGGVGGGGEIKLTTRHGKKRGEDGCGGGKWASQVAVRE